MYTLEFLLSLPEPLQLREILVQYEDLGEAQSGHLIGMSARSDKKCPTLSCKAKINFPVNGTALFVALAHFFLYFFSSGKINLIKQRTDANKHRKCQKLVFAAIKIAQSQ